MTLTDADNEIYAGLYGLQVDKTLADYLGHAVSDPNFISNDSDPHMRRPTPPVPVLPNSVSPYHGGICSVM